VLVIDSLWGESPPPSAPGALHAYVSRLRSALEPGRAARSKSHVVVSEGTGYVLRLPRAAVDAWQFEDLVDTAGRAEQPGEAVRSLTEALDLWRGPAYAEYADQAWAEPEVVRLSQLRDLARERLLAARLDGGESAVLVPHLEALVAEEPMREERWRLLALALYRSNRQSDALAALRRARTLLVEELGVDPGADLQQLEAAVLAQSDSLLLPARPAVSAPSVVHSRPFVPAPDHLVDRERELDQLRQCLDGAVGGQGRLALVSGPAGIGKSRLLAEARGLAAERGALALTARGSQMEKEYAFGAVRQLFEPVLAQQQNTESLFSGSARSAAGVFDVGAADPGTTDGSLAVLHGLYWLTVNLAAERPVMVAMDDLQWCDTGSLRFLAYLAHRLEGLPVLVVGAVRTGEEHDDGLLLDELSSTEVTVPLQPTPLSREGVGAVVRSRFGRTAPDALVAACHRATGGNPLLLRELLRALEAEGVPPEDVDVDHVIAIGSRAVSSMVLRRLARLPSPASQTAQAIAVLGDGASLLHVAALAGTSESEAATAVAAMVRAEVARSDYPLGFVHPLVADAVYRDLSAGERELRHERAAHVLRDAGAPGEKVAAHLLKSPHRGDPWVVEVLRSAAERAVERGAPDIAITYLERALEEPPAGDVRPHVLHELGRVQVMSNGPAGVAHLREAYAGLTDPATRLEVAQLITRALVFAGSAGEPTAFAQQVLAENAEDLLDQRQGLQALARVAGYMHGVPPEVWRTGTPTVVGSGSGARLLAAELAWEAVVDGTDRETAVRHAHFALAGDDLLVADISLLWVVAVIALQYADEDTTEYWERGMAYSYRAGSMWGVLANELWRGHLSLLRGDLADAIEAFTISTEQQNRWGNRMLGAIYSESMTVDSLLERGDVAGARAMLDSIRGRERAGDGVRLFDYSEIRVLTAEGRYDDALAACDARLDQMTVIANPFLRPWRSLKAAVLVGLGRRDEAEALLEDELAAARRWGAPTFIGRSLRLLGELRGVGGADELREAVTLLAPGRARLEYARALAALAAVLDRQEERVVLWEQALSLADACGAEGLVSDIAARLAEAGVPSAVTTGRATAVSPMERRVGRRHLAGLDDRAIAQELFLTPHAVRTTVGSLRERFGDDLARILDDGGRFAG
jgi:DNA-binding SARP family transcriptional activator/tetratricopeptide (TPR) repeat protein